MTATRARASPTRQRAACRLGILYVKIERIETRKCWHLRLLEAADSTSLHIIKIGNGRCHLASDSLGEQLQLFQRDLHPIVIHHTLRNVIAQHHAICLEIAG
jgi:hypothetical protein